MAKFRVLTLSLATLAVVAGQRQQFNFDNGPSGPRPTGPGRGPSPPSFPYRLLSAMQEQGRGIKELFTSASSANPQYRNELFGPPRGPTHHSAPPKSATFFLEPPTREASSFYGGRGPPKFGRGSSSLFNPTNLKNPISLTASETSNQLPQEYAFSSPPGSRGRPSPSVQEIVAQAAQAQHGKVVRKEQRAHPNGRITHSHITVAGPGGLQAGPPQFQDGLGFNPYASQIIGGQQDHQQLVMTRGPDGQPMLLQVQNSGPVQYSSQQQGSVQFSGQQGGPGAVQYLSQQQPQAVQYLSQQQQGPVQYVTHQSSPHQSSGQQQIQLSAPQQQSFDFGGQQGVQYTSIGGQQPGQEVQYIQSSAGQAQVPTTHTSRPSSSSSSQSVADISLTNYPQQFIQQNPSVGQQFDASPFLSQGGFPGHVFPLEGPSTVYQQGQNGQQGQQFIYQSQGQEFGAEQPYILQSAGIQQLQQNQIEQPKQAQSQSLLQSLSSQSSQQRAKEEPQYQIQTAISESFPEQRLRSGHNVKPSSPGSNASPVQFLQQDALGTFSGNRQQNH